MYYFRDTKKNTLLVLMNGIFNIRFLPRISHIFSIKTVKLNRGIKRIILEPDKSALNPIISIYYLGNFYSYLMFQKVSFFTHKIEKKIFISWSFWNYLVGLTHLWYKIRKSLWGDCAVLCLVVQSCGSLCDPMECSPPASSACGYSSGKNTGVACHAVFQGIFPPRDQTQVSRTIGRFLPSEPPGNPQNTGMGSLFLLQEIFPIQESNQGLLYWR